MKELMNLELGKYYCRLIVKLTCLLFLIAFGFCLNSQELVEVDQGDIQISSEGNNHVGLRLKQSADSVFANVEIEHFGNKGELTFNNSINWYNGGGTYRSDFPTAISRMDTRASFKGFSWLWSLANDNTVNELLRLTSEGDLFLESSSSAPFIDIAKPKMRIKKLNSQTSGLLIENEDGDADTWIPYTDGEIYLTGDRTAGKTGNIHLRSFEDGIYSDHFKVVPSTDYSIFSTRVVLRNNHTNIGINGADLKIEHPPNIKESGLAIINGARTNKQWIINEVNDAFDHDDEALKFWRKDGSTMALPALLETDGTWVKTSDRKLKKDIVSLKNGQLEKVKKIKTYNFQYKNQENDKIQFGVMAQELQKIYPNLVSEMTTGNLGVDYDSLVPILTKAIQEQQNIIEKLERRIQKLESKE